jgi:hypothetical protein
MFLCVCAESNAATTLTATEDGSQDIFGREPA